MRRDTATLLFFAVYTLGYSAFAIANVNPEGTGTAVFLLPLGAWVLMLGAVYALIRYEQLSSWAITFVLFSLLHYVATIGLIVTFPEDPYGEESRLARAWVINTFWVGLTIAWYLVGQIILWVLFFLRWSSTTQAK